MINRIDHVNIVVSDLKRLQDFFDLFGFIPIDAAGLSAGGSRPSSTCRMWWRCVRMELPGTALKVELIAYDHSGA